MTLEEKKIAGHVSDKHTCQNHEQNISKMNFTVHLKGHTQRSIGIYSLDASLVHHMHISKYNTPC